MALAERVDLEQIDQELSAFAAFVAERRPLQRVLTNPAIPASSKRAVIEPLLERVGPLLAAVVEAAAVAGRARSARLLPECCGATANGSWTTSRWFAPR